MAERDQDDGDADTDGLEGEQGSFEDDGIRRPMNAFFIFCKRHRDVVREKYPHLENRSITKILGEWWANLDSTEKSSYTALAKQYKEAFMKAHPDFKWYKLPTAPTRTLITRPSNNRCLQTKKDKVNVKSASCGIALGKLVDDKELGGLSSLVSQCGTTEVIYSSADVDSNDSVPSPTTPSVPVSCNKILKPPKKRYLINGEFKCQSESSLKYDNRDYKTKNACSALLELAEICVNTSGQSLSSTIVPSTSNEESLYGNVSSYTKPSEYLPFSSSNTRSDSKQPKSNPCLINYFKTSTPLCSSKYFSHNSSLDLQEVQDQPLNLCKQKEQMFTASNQQLINHLVDKFLCDSSNQTQPTTNAQVPHSISAVFRENKPSVIQGFTLSAAIESAIDQAYSQSSPKSSCVRLSETKMAQSESEENTEIVFVDKITKACLASSHKLSEKTESKQYTLPLMSKEEEDTKSTAAKDKEVEIGNDKTVESPSISDPLQSNITGDNVVHPSSSSKETDMKFSSSNYYSKCGSPPKKSRVWCNLFMKEQLKLNDQDGSTKDPLLFDLASPVRRNSQRTCKGRRYQALITEGLLQSTKERKASIGKRPLPVCEKPKAKASPSPPIPLPLPRSKRKRKETSENINEVKREDEENEEDLDVGRSEFDLNEKIASLPKCSFETLHKKRKASIKSPSDSKPVASVKPSKKLVKEKASNVQAEDTSSKTDDDETSPSLSSSGRFKSGEFDLEQHIASLPKCDIEVLNKRRSKKE